MGIEIDIRKYIAGVSKAESNSPTILGTAFVITDMHNGYLATCYHVIGIRISKKLKSNLWNVWFDEVDQPLTAAVDIEHSNPDADIAVLKMMDRLPDSVKVCPLGSFFEQDEPFRSYGYALADEGYIGLPAKGTIDALISAPTQKGLEKGHKLIKLRSTDIDNGMSGAPVFSEKSSYAVGIISIANHTQWNRHVDLAFARPVTELLSLWPELKDLSSPRWRLERERPLQTKGRANILLPQYLEYLYSDYSLLERGGQKYPILTFAVNDQDQGIAPQSILASLDLSRINERDFVLNDDEYLEMRRHDKGRLDNNPTYISKNITLSPQIRIDGGVGTYFQALTTCDTLEWEILTFFGENNPTPDDFAHVLEKLPNRYNLHQKIPDPVLRGDGRSAAIAMSTLTVLTKEDNDYIAILCQRSKDVAVHGHLYHVIPSFMFQPVKAVWAEDEWQVIHQLFRELLEETFNKKELEDPEKHGKNPIFYNWFYYYPEKKLIEELINTGKAIFRLTGLAVNLLNLRPEILTVLFVKEPIDDLYMKIDLNWEWAKEIDSRAKLSEDTYIKGQNIRLVHLGPDKDMLEKHPIKPGEMVPPGAAALWLGVDAVGRMLGVDFNR